jgi:hypothetical protein
MKMKQIKNGREWKKKKTKKEKSGIDCKKKTKQEKGGREWKKKT